MATKKDKDTPEASLDYSQYFSISADLIPTGLLPLDTVLGGGYEAGDVISVTSEAGTGKSTLFLTLAKNFIQQGHRVAYFDVEKGVKMGILNNFGLSDYTGCDIENSQFFLIKPDTYAVMERAFRDCIKFGFKYIFIDSMTALVDSSVMENDEIVCDRITIGESARVETKLYPVIKSLARMSGTTVFIVQQMRIRMESRGRMMVASKDSGGGFAARHTPDVRLFMEKGPKYVDERVGLSGDKEKIEYGNEARLYAEKNRNAPPFIKVPCPIVYGMGMKNTLYLEIVLKNNGVIKSAGPYYKIYLDPDKEPETVQGKANLLPWISNHLDECIALVKKNGWSELKAVEVV